MASPTRDYSAFLDSKQIVSRPAGIPVDRDSLNPKLLDFQRDVTAWALRRGKAALFEDCGLGKTFQQLEWGHRVSIAQGRRMPVRFLPGSVLILAPSAVAEQTAEIEGPKFDIPVTLCESQSDVKPGVNITNYEKLHKFSPEGLDGIVLDESSILKAFDGKTRSQLIRFADSIPFRLACTATPSPNDYTELGNHAEFLGVMKMSEMLATFFVHDGGDTSKWRLKKHAVAAFHQWIATWAVMFRKPSDLGYSDVGFDIPPLHMHECMVPVESSEGFLFPMEGHTLMERRAARRDSMTARVKALRDLVFERPLTEKWLVWCDLNAEQAELEDAFLDDCVSIQGSTPEKKRIELEHQWRLGPVPIMITKPSVFGWGMNWQHCHNVAFVGLSDSYEQFYQAIRRCWRFGQAEAVNCYVIAAETEGAVVRNIQRKEKQAQEMNAGMVKHMADISRTELQGTARKSIAYETDVKQSPRWTSHLGDCVETTAKLPDASVDYVVYSPPFASLYTYSASERDMGNARSHSEFFDHYAFLVAELYRSLKPGRLLSFHCMNLPISKQFHGYIGIEDFRGDLIRIHQKAGFIYHSEVCIWKDPVTAMQRTKALGLLYKQLRKDSCMSRQGIPDYLVTMRKPGENPEPVTKTHEGFPVGLWQRYASPVWMDINPSDTLQKESAREQADERHICPLQLEVIRRAIELWTNPDDLVLSPFGGIGSEGYVALQLGRRATIIELKRSYWEQACRNLAAAEQHQEQTGLFATTAQDEQDIPQSSDEFGIKQGQRDRIVEDVISRAPAWGPWTGGA